MTIENSRPDSVLDNKATFLQFLSSEDARKFTSKNNFLKVQYRKFNLSLATALENSSFRDHDTIRSTISALRSCSSLALLEIDDQGANIVQTSKKCRNKFCAICARAKSKMISDRIITMIKSKEDQLNIEEQRAYFLTLTLKNDSKSRSEVYTTELKDYIYKLLRSTLFKKYFTSDSNHILSGQFRNLESTFYYNRSHIHSHVLILAPRLKQAIKRVQTEFKQKWLKLTKDSHNVRIDLIRTQHQNNNDNCNYFTSQEFLSAIKEVVKYSVKVSAKKNELPAVIDRIADFIIKSKGVNFMTTSGDLRGHQLTAWKSKYDSEFEGINYDMTKDYTICKTSQIHFNNEIDFYQADRRRNNETLKQRIHYVKGSVYKLSKSDYEIKSAISLNINEVFLPQHFEELAAIQGLKVEDIETMTNQCAKSDELKIKGNQKVLSTSELEFLKHRGKQKNIEF